MLILPPGEFFVFDQMYYFSDNGYATLYAEVTKMTALEIYPLLNDEHKAMLICRLLEIAETEHICPDRPSPVPTDD